MGDAGVVDQDVDEAEAGLCLRKNQFASVRIACIGLYSQAGGTCLFYFSFQLQHFFRLRHTIYYDVVTGSPESKGRRTADSAGRAGDEHCFIHGNFSFPAKYIIKRPILKAGTWIP